MGEKQIKVLTGRRLTEGYEWYSLKGKAVATGWGIQSDEAGKLAREGQEPESRDRDQNPGGTGVRAREG